jgi:uracil phosphoribosyltransferase
MPFFSGTPANARISSNPFVTSKIDRIRDRTISSSIVRTTTAELSRILAVEATQNDHHTGKVALIIVLRSGLAMSDAFLGQLAPDRDVVVYHIGMFRDRATLTPVEYYNKLPSNNTEVKRAYVLDPLIATGGTGGAVIEILRYVFALLLLS